MIATWSVCAILFASVLGARAAPLEDDPLVEKVKEIVSDVDDYIASHNLTELRIPDIDYRFSPIKIKNGGFGDFSTIELQDGTSVQESKLEDNSTLYKFNVKVGLVELRFRYDYEVDTFVYKQAGNFSISVVDNSAELTGFAVVHTDNSCRALLASVKVLRYGKYLIDLEPDNFPEVTALSEQILDFVTPYLLPLSNKALTTTVFVPQVQQKFSEFTCNKIGSL